MDPDLQAVRREVAQKRRQSDEEEYQRYLDEMMTDLSRDPNLREDLIEDIQSTNDGAGHEGDADILKIALRLKNEERVRNILEEKERRLIEAQRHAARLEEERRLNVKPNPEDVPETEDDTAADLFLHPDSTQDQIAAVVKRRASLLGDLDARHKASFVHKEMKRELAFRHSVAVEKDADKKRELIEQHKRTLEELKQRTSSLPGHAQQLQDVWEKEDGMADKFNPKVFFALHDINSDGLWDHKELEALFYRSATRLHTVYANRHPMSSVCLCLRMVCMVCMCMCACVHVCMCLCKCVCVSVCFCVCPLTHVLSPVLSFLLSTAMVRRTWTPCARR